MDIDLDLYRHEVRVSTNPLVRLSAIDISPDHPQRTFVFIHGFGAGRTMALPIEKVFHRKPRHRAGPGIKMESAQLRRFPKLGNASPPCKELSHLAHTDECLLVPIVFTAATCYTLPGLLVKDGHAASPFTWNV